MSVAGNGERWDRYEPPLLFSAIVYYCTRDSRHVVYMEPGLTDDRAPGGLIGCPFKDGVMELRDKIELVVSAGARADVHTAGVGDGTIVKSWAEPGETSPTPPVDLGV